MYVGPSQVTVQLRWPRTDFAREEDLVFDHTWQLVGAPTWGFVMHIAPDAADSDADIVGEAQAVIGQEGGRAVQKPYCSLQDFRRWDDEEEGRWEGRWVREGDTETPHSGHVHGEPGVRREMVVDGEGVKKGEGRKEILARLHSDGWMFERDQCRLQLYNPDEAWERVDGRWIVMLGVSTMQVCS